LTFTEETVPSNLFSKLSMQETRVVEDILVIPEAGIRTFSHNQDKERV